MQKRDFCRTARVLLADQDWLCGRVILASHTDVHFGHVCPQERPAGGCRMTRWGLSLKELQVVGRLALLTAGVQEALLPQGGDGLLPVVLHQLRQGGVL